MVVLFSLFFTVPSFAERQTTSVKCYSASTEKDLVASIPFLTTTEPSKISQIHKNLPSEMNFASRLAVVKGRKLDPRVLKKKVGVEIEPSGKAPDENEWVYNTKYTYVLFKLDKNIEGIRWAFNTPLTLIPKQDVTKSLTAKKDKLHALKAIFSKGAGHIIYEDGYRKNIDGRGMKFSSSISKDGAEEIALVEMSTHAAFEKDVEREFCRLKDTCEFVQVGDLLLIKDLTQFSVLMSRDSIVAFSGSSPFQLEVSLKAEGQRFSYFSSSIDGQGEYGFFVRHDHRDKPTKMMCTGLD